MDTASRLVCQFACVRDGLGRWGSVTVLAALAVAGVLIGDHLLPTSEPLVMAPLRWGTLARL